MSKRPSPQPAAQVVQLLTIPQVAAALCIHRATVYDLIHREGLPAMKLGRCTRVNAARLQEWVAQREQFAS